MLQMPHSIKSGRTSPMLWGRRPACWQPDTARWAAPIREQIRMGTCGWASEGGTALAGSIYEVWVQDSRLTRR